LPRACGSLALSLLRWSRAVVAVPQQHPARRLHRLRVPLNANPERRFHRLWRH